MNALASWLLAPLLLQAPDLGLETTIGIALAAPTKDQDTISVFVTLR